MRKRSFLIRFLIISNFLLLGSVAFMIITGFAGHETKKKFTEIDVERINVIGIKGKPVLTISNSRLMPGPGMNGKVYARDVIDGREYMNGLIFFNDYGDEVGGLVYTGLKKDSVNYSAVGHLSFDQWHQNQVLALDYNDKSGNRFAGLRVWDRPTNASFDKMLDLIRDIQDAKNDPRRADSLRKLWTEARDRGENGVERMFIGSKNEEAQIQLKDKKGNVRARLLVDNKTGDAHLEFLNEKGVVTSTFPQ